VEYTTFEEHVETLAKLIDEGKVRHWGLSNESSFGVMRHCQAADSLRLPRPVSVQNCFNMLHRFVFAILYAASPNIAMEFKLFRRRDVARFAVLAVPAIVLRAHFFVTAKQCLVRA
jgi:diketogulonate reductase-like aldo/keto reductase